MTNDIRKILNIKNPNIHFSPDSVQEQDTKLSIHCLLTDPVYPYLPVTSSDVLFKIVSPASFYCVAWD